MKTSVLLIGLALTATNGFAAGRRPLAKSDFLVIDVGDDALDATPSRGRVDEARDLRDANRDLRRRVRQLERAVIQLQDEVYLLSQRLDAGGGQEAVIVTSASAARVACSLTTSFHGTHVASASTQLEATAKVLKACEKSGEPFCRKDDVTCERAN